MSGIHVGNITDSWIGQYNISDCDTAINVNNSNPENNGSVYFAFGEIKNCSTGLLINSSSNTKIGYTDFNCTETNISYANCDINNLLLSNCTSPGNIAPDKPSKVSMWMKNTKVPFLFLA